MSVWSTMLDELREAAHGAVPTVEIEALAFEIPPDAAMGDLAVPCFVLGKQLSEKPQAIASRIADALAAHPLVAQAGVAGAYCNITLDAGEVAQRVLAVPAPPPAPPDAAAQRKPAGIPTSRRDPQDEGEGQEVILEFISPNANKPLHLGHLRNAFYGEAVARLLEATGHTVRRVLLLNDRGIAMAKAMLAYARWGAGSTPESEGLKGDHFVGNWYVVFDQKQQHDAGLLEEAQELVRKWEAGDQETLALWQRMVDWVIAGHEETYGKLGVAFERTYRESAIYEQGRAIVERGVASGTLTHDAKGNTVAKLDAVGLDDKVVIRADGTTVYATQDLALVAAKARDDGGARQIVITAVEQDYYFKQLNAILTMLGMPTVEHLSYEMVNLPEGKMKSREGTVVDADDLIAKITQLAEEEIARREDPVPGEPDAGTDEPPIVARNGDRARASAIAMAALRFMLLSVSPRSTVTFDPHAAVAFSGKTGPYLQYAHARMCAILRKVEGARVASMRRGLTGKYLFEQPSEKQLLCMIARFEDVLVGAARERDPSTLAQFLYEFAKTFADFYRDAHVLVDDVDIGAQRGILLEVAQQTLARGLTILGIEPLERM
ncbi:MAG: arginine--tRNA ligase [bacterium]|nr:arginine--tRNA ligase [bacterium]